MDETAAEPDDCLALRVEWNLANPQRLLSRRNRAAVLGALECLRLWSYKRPTEDAADTALVDACDALSLIGTEEVSSIGDALPRERRARQFIIGDERLLRARLALLLRALLRADAGKWPFEYYLCCRVCRRDAGWPKTSDMVCKRCPGILEICMRRRGRITPLWELAPAYRGARERAA